MKNEIEEKLKLFKIWYEHNKKRLSAMYEQYIKDIGSSKEDYDYFQFTLDIYYKYPDLLEFLYEEGEHSTPLD